MMGRSTDAGNSFAPAVRVNDTYLNAEYSYNFPPRMAFDDSGNVHVTWFDQRFEHTNCFYDESVDGGQTFSVDAIVNDNRDSLSHSLPRIAAGNGQVYIVYMDKRNGNNFYDIFFTARGGVPASRGPLFRSRGVSLWSRTIPIRSIRPQSSGSQSLPEPQGPACPR